MKLNNRYVDKRIVHRNNLFKVINWETQGFDTNVVILESVNDYTKREVTQDEFENHFTNKPTQLETYWKTL